MTIHRIRRVVGLFAFPLVATVLLGTLGKAQVSVGGSGLKSSAAVTVIDNGASWTLDNGIVKATIRKGSGSMASLVYHGIEMMGGNGGYWEQTPQDAPQLTNTITIDPDRKSTRLNSSHRCISYA